ncbi:hypothetical protein AB837_00601 [bacterium AB1]|nr:hypothetical protein AB837_00601 [bacterium AB1]
MLFFLKSDMKPEEIKECKDISTLQIEIKSKIIFLRERFNNDMNFFDNMNFSYPNELVNFSNPDKLVSQHIQFEQNPQDPNNSIVLFNGQILTDSATFIQKDGYKMFMNFMNSIHDIYINLFRSHALCIQTAQNDILKLFHYPIPNEEEYKSRYCEILLEIQNNYEKSVLNHSENIQECYQQFINYFKL